MVEPEKLPDQHLVIDDQYKILARTKKSRKTWVLRPQNWKQFLLLY